MIELELIRSVITIGLSNLTGMPAVELDANEAPAAYPFMMYSFAGPVLFPDKPPAVTTVPSSTENELIERYTEQPTFRMSFLSCSDNKAASLTNAIRMHDWFRILGQDELRRSANTVVVLAGEIQNRDVQNGAVWERRFGFDVALKTTSVTDMKQTTIDHLHFN